MTTAWIRVLLCSGPRQVVNAFTLKSVYESKLAVSVATVEGSIMGFFDKIRALATQDYQQALILSGMLFTLIIWVFSALFLLIGVIFYVFFLWHWIPKADGGLSGHCERRVNTALLEIVSETVNTALAKEEQNRMKAEFRAAKKNGEKLPPGRQATLPTLPNVETPGGEDKLPQMPTLHRNDTMTTLPPYTSRPGTPGSFELNSLDQKRPMPVRTGTMSSAASYSSRAPLMSSASEMGLATPSSPAPSVPSLDHSAYPPPLRPGTSNSQRSLANRPPIGRMGTHGSQSSFSSLNRTQAHGPQGSTSSFGGLYTESPATFSTETMPPFPPPVRSPTARTMDSYRGPRDNYSMNGRPSPTTRATYDDYSDGRSSPAPSAYSSRGGGGGLPRNPAPMNGSGHQPMRSATNPVLPRGPQYPPQRNMTAPVPPRQQTGDDYFSSRSPTTQSSRGVNRGQDYGYDSYDVESQRDRRY
jgi:hypothetical protein